jgi:ParB/RepB/Spo0J family partition protein
MTTAESTVDPIDPDHVVADAVETDAVDAEQTEPELCWLNMGDLAPHPDNPRRSLGDLTELVRSIRSHGILEPLVVLPADDGVYWIVAGHRRHAAGIEAGVTDVPAVVRPMNPSEVIEAMLSENVNRSDLTQSEEVRAIERLMSLDEGLTPAKLCRRIGRSQAWVRARMAVTILPARWREALDDGELTLAAGEAAATVADLGPEHLDAVCDLLAGRGGWDDPTRTVAGYREDLRRQEAYDQAVANARAAGGTVFTSDDPPPSKAKRLGELFDADNTKAHAGEPCHAVLIQRTRWGQGVDVSELCSDPARHAPKRVGTDKGSDLASDHNRPRPSGDDSHAKRQGRLARLAHLTETFARSRGGISQADLTRIALRGLVFEAGREAIGYAATMLGHDHPRDVTAEELLDGVKTPAALARVAGAVAAGLAESHMYWSATSTPCREYLDLLIGSGWSPDAWTAAVLARNSTDANADNPGDGEPEASENEPGDTLDTEDHGGNSDPGLEPDDEAGDAIDKDEEPRTDVHDPAA